MGKVKNWMEKFFGLRDNNLYVITTIFNPKKYKSRYKLYKEFEKHVLESGAILIVIEATFRNEAPEVVETMSDRHYIIHVKASSELWLKENLINIALRRMNYLFPRWRYVAWVDADIAFARPDWVGETKRLLHRHPMIQMFSHINQLNSKYQPMPGFGLSFMEGVRRGLVKSDDKGEKIRYGWCGSPGGAWAATRQCITEIGGLLDIGILGSGDFHMANALIGHVEYKLTPSYTDGYIKSLLQWQDHTECIRNRVGMMPGLILHYWHGSMKDRGYETRWELMVKHKYNPETDIIENREGVYSIHPSNQGLIEDIETYFLNRNEDAE